MTMNNTVSHLRTDDLKHPQVRIELQRLIQWHLLDLKVVGRFAGCYHSCPKQVSSAHVLQSHVLR